MFVCDDCYEADFFMLRSYGRCEMCGRTKICYDVPPAFWDNNRVKDKNSADDEWDEEAILDLSTISGFLLGRIHCPRCNSGVVKIRDKFVCTTLNCSWKKKI